jgi:hypothetical protein
MAGSQSRAITIDIASKAFQPRAGRATCCGAMGCYSGFDSVCSRPFTEDEVEAIVRSPPWHWVIAALADKAAHTK